MTLLSITSLWEWHCLSSWRLRIHLETGGRRSVAFYQTLSVTKWLQLCDINERMSIKNIRLLFRLNVRRWKSVCWHGRWPIRTISVSMQSRFVMVCWLKRLIRGWVLRMDAVMRSERTHFSVTSTGGNWMQVPSIFCISCSGLCITWNKHFKKHKIKSLFLFPWKWLKSTYTVRFFNYHFSPHQVFYLLLSSQTRKWCTLKVWMTLGPSPLWREWHWRTLTRPFLMSFPRGTSPYPGKKRWSIQAFMESSTFGVLMAASQMTSAGSPY